MIKFLYRPLRLLLSVTGAIFPRSRDVSFKRPDRARRQGYDGALATFAGYCENMVPSLVPISATSSKQLARA
jgi:hypothetical protein